MDGETMRRVTIIIEEIGTNETGSIKVSTDSIRYGHGTVVAHLSEVVQGALKMWAAVDPQSTTPREDPPRIMRPRPAPGRPE